MQLLPQLIESLVLNSKAVALKKETEAEGASHEDIFLFRAMAWRVRLPLYVKIGGAEALTDVKLCQRAQADGIIMPMAESPFAVQKFLGIIDSVYRHDFQPRLVINIESKLGIERLDSILAICKGCIHGITIGRTDLSASFNDPAITADSPSIMRMIEAVASRLAGEDFTLNVGGGVNVATPNQLKAFPGLSTQIQCIETRNVVFQSNASTQDIKAALQFEQGYLQYQRQWQEEQLAQSNERLKKLAERLT